MFIPAAADSYLGGIPLATVKEGTVSGGLFIDAYPGLATSAEKQFSLPKFTEVMWARMYIDVYCGHMENNNRVLAIIDFNGGDGYRNLATEDLNVPYSFPGEGGTGPVQVNDHCNRVTSDYLMWYDLTDLITRQAVGARVRTQKPPGYNGTFDGRIKTITLVVAYDDGDSDKVLYWVNEGHDPDSYKSEEAGNKYFGETEFRTSGIGEDWEKATLNAVYMSSIDGEYTFNGNDLDSSRPLGQYFGINTWDVSSDLEAGKDSTFTYRKNPESGAYGQYYKIFLAALSIKYAGQSAGEGGSGGGADGQGGSGVFVTSSPNGAEIFVDDIDTGAFTNATLYTLSPGTHRFRVEKEGFQATENQVADTPAGIRTTVHFDLGPAGGDMTVRSAPPGAVISVDGNLTGVTTPATVRNLEEGPHRVLLSAKGYEDYSATVLVKSGETADLNASLIRDDAGTVQGVETGPASGTVTRQAFERREESGYAGMALTPALSGTVEGNMSIATSSDYTGLMFPGEFHSFPLTADIPENATVEAARLYVYTTWSHDDRTRVGKYSILSASFNGHPLAIDAIYSDKKDSGVYAYPAETYAYDVTHLVGQAGDYMVVVSNNGTGSDVTALYGVMLVTVYANPGDPVISYWMAVGSDSVYSNLAFNITDREAETTAIFDGYVNLSGISGAHLFTISTAATGMKTDANGIRFNGNEWTNLLAGGPSSISLADIDVRPFLKASGNTGSIASVKGSGSKGDYMENRGMILVLTHGVPPQPGSSRNAAGIPLPVRLIEVSRDFGLHVSRWLLYLAGVGDTSLEDQPDCSCSDQERAPAPTSLMRTGGGSTTSLAVPAQSAVTAPPAPVPTASILFPSEGEMSGGAFATQPPAGGVSVSSFPQGADIYLDGRKTPFTTPFILYGLKEGTHTVTVKKEKNSYPVSSRQVYVPADTIIPVHFSTGPDVGRTIHLDMRGFSGDKITVNGMAPAITPPALLDVEGEDAFISVMHNGSFISFALPSLFQDGNSFVVREDIPRTYPVIEIRTTPPGAEVYIDGIASGIHTPAEVRNISDGTHRIDVYLPGYLPAGGTDSFVDTSRTTDYTLNFLLEPYAWGTLRVNSDPPGAKIALYGKDSGMKTPAVIPYLAMGQYEIRVTAGDVTRTRDVMVLPGRNETITFDLNEI